ncbi:MAG: hypothetical protein AAGA42_21245, partial [Actinomycetota bacterium]
HSVLMGTEDDFWGDAGDWSGTTGADRRPADRTPATDPEPTPTAWVTGRIARVFGGPRAAGRRQHGDAGDARWTAEIPVVGSATAPSDNDTSDAPAADTRVPVNDVPEIVDATADTLDDDWLNADDDWYGDPAGASPNPTDDEAWESLDDWDVEPAQQRKLPIDPLLAKLGVLAVVVTLAVPLILSLRSGADSATLETAATELPAAEIEPTPTPTTVANDAPAEEAVSESESTTAEPATAATTIEVIEEATTSVDADPEPATRRAVPAVTEAGTNADAQSDASSDQSATDVTANACGADYDVVGGDFWIRLADGAGVDVDELLAVNDATLQTPLFPGSTICLPVGASTPPPPPATTAAPTTAAPTTVAPTTAAPTTAAPTTAAPTTAAPTTAAPTTAASANGAPASSSPDSPGPNASPEQVQQIIRDIWPDELEERAIEIAWRESNWIPTADNGHCCHGVFQIYWTVHRGWLADFGVTSLEQLYDPVINTQMALEIYNRAGGWGPWGF